MTRSTPSAWALCLIFLLAVAAWTTATATTTTSPITGLTSEQYQHLFVKFVDHYDKVYETNAVLGRLGVFNKNLDLIVAHNNDKTKTSKLAVNQFADLTSHEFHAMVSKGLSAPPAGLDTKMQYESAVNQRLINTHLATPAVKKTAASPYISWLNYSLPIRNQGSCGSCVSFSTTTTLSTQININYGEKLVLAPQQIVDCQNLCLHCNGCVPPLAADYINHMGVALEQDYPYTGKWDEKTSVCGEHSVSPARHTRGTKQILVHGDEELQAALQHGPVTALLAASSSAFQFYKSGVLNDCTDLLFNHAISVHGFLKDEETGLEYYQIVNSWGTTWGTNGLINIVAGSGGFKSCGLGLSFDSSLVLVN